MSFTVNFYNISDAPNVLNKTVGTALASRPCTPFEQVSGLHGRILLDYNPAIETANYCHVSAGDNDGRPLYCWVRDFTRDTGSRMTVELEIDPLMTNKTQIESCSGVLASTTYYDDWSRYMVGDIMVMAYGINKGSNSEKLSALDYDDDHVFLGIYG